MATSDPDFAQAAIDFKRGGWITGLLGVAGMLARMLLSKETYTWCVWVRKAVAGGIAGVIAYFALHGSDIPTIYKSVISSTAGALAPELFELLTRRVIRFNEKAKGNKKKKS
jgi:hypothetical protein